MPILTSLSNSVPTAKTPYTETGAASALSAPLAFLSPTPSSLSASHPHPWGPCVYLLFTTQWTREVVLTQIHSWDLRSEKSCDLPGVTQLGRGRAKTHTLDFLPPNPILRW